MHYSANALIIRNALFNKCTACKKCTNFGNFLMNSEMCYMSFLRQCSFKKHSCLYKQVLFYIWMSHPTTLIPIIMQNL